MLTSVSTVQLSIALNGLFHSTKLRQSSRQHPSFIRCVAFSCVGGFFEYEKSGTLAEGCNKKAIERVRQFVNRARSHVMCGPLGHLVSSDANGSEHKEPEC